MTRSAARITALSAGISVLLALGAHAQEAGGIPGYEQVGIRAGSFMVYPQASITESYDDNVYATANNKSEDFITTLGARVEVNSTWSRHALNLRGSLAQALYADNSDEDRFDWDVGAGGRLDVTSTTELSGALGYAVLHEDRGDPNSPFAASEPVEYSLATASAKLKQSFNRISVSVGGEYREYDYDDATSTAGTNIEQDDRDFSQYIESLRLAYNVSPDTSIYVEGGLDQREYDEQFLGVNRDSDGWRMVAGSDFMLTNLAEGGAYVGYSEREYDNPAFSSSDGIVYGANVDWFVTRLTTVTFTADAQVKETNVTGSSGYDSQQVGVDVNHSLLRNVILRGGFSYGNDDFNDSGREDDIIGAHAGVSYLLNRNFDISLGYTYTDRDSSIATADYTRNVVGVTLTGKL